MPAHDLLIVFLAAAVCVFARAYLNVFDRLVYKKEAVDFFKSLVLNSVYPFLIALAVAVTASGGKPHLREYILLPGVILSALGAQLAAYVFAFSFSKMPLKSVVLSTKIVDLFIPLLLAAITSKFNLSDYVFSCISVAIFLPLIFPLKKTESNLQLRMIAAIMLVLPFQACINGYFCIDKLADSTERFLSLICCILFWRAVIILLPYSLRHMTRDKKGAGKKNEVCYILLFFRSVVSFLSQAAFFYSITRVSGNLAWPILNAAPLTACFTAHFVLQERVGKSEIAAFAALTILTIAYLSIST